MLTPSTEKDLADYRLEELPPPRKPRCGDFRGGCGRCLVCKVTYFGGDPPVNHYGVSIGTKDHWGASWRAATAARQAQIGRAQAVEAQTKPASAEDKKTKPQDRFNLLEID